MLEGFIVIKIHNDDNDTLIHTVVHDDKFQINCIRSGEQELEGQITFHEIRTFAGTLEFHTYPELLQLQIKILTTTSLKDIEFYFDPKSLKLSWKRGNTIKITYGSVLMKERSGIRDEILRSSFAKISNLQKLEEVHAQKLDDFYAKQVLFQKEFDRLVQRERNIQSDLYSKFAVVLNTKKQKIVELKSLIFDRGEEADPIATDASQPTTSKVVKRQLSATDSENSSPVQFELPKRKKVVGEVATQVRRTPTPPEAGPSKTSKGREGASPKANDDDDDAYEVDTQKMFDQMSG